MWMKKGEIVTSWRQAKDPVAQVKILAELNGVAEDVYDKNEIDPEGVDKMADNMAAELADRGIVIAGDPWYDEIVKIRERKEEAASGAGTRGNGEE